MEKVPYANVIGCLICAMGYVDADYVGDLDKRRLEGITATNCSFVDHISVVHCFGRSWKGNNLV